MLLPGGFVSAQWIWAGVVIICALIEMFTFGLTTVWFAISALLMVFVSLLQIPFAVQVLIFLAVAAALLVFTRPLAIKKLKMGREKTNVDSFVGKHVLITKAVGEFEKGEAKLNGLVWIARAENNSAISIGTKCEIVRIEGVQLIVRPVGEASPHSGAVYQNAALAAR